MNKYVLLVTLIALSTIGISTAFAARANRVEAGQGAEGGGNTCDSCGNMYNSVIFMNTSDPKADSNAAWLFCSALEQQCMIGLDCMAVAPPQDR